MANEIEKRNEAFLIYQDENGIRFYPHILPSPPSKADVQGV